MYPHIFERMFKLFAAKFDMSNVTKASQIGDSVYGIFNYVLETDKLSEQLDESRKRRRILYSAYRKKYKNHPYY